VTKGLLTPAGLLFTAVMTLSGAAAQQVAKVPRVGFLNQTSPDRTKAGEEFREGMRALGWIDGSTVTIEDRFAYGDAARLSANAADLVTAKVDVIVAIGVAPALAARQATSIIPIIMDTGDPIGLGLVASLARPGGNVTGLSVMYPDLVAKQLATLKEAVPVVSKIGILRSPDASSHAQLLIELERAAPKLGVSVMPLPVRNGQDLSALFDDMAAAGADGYFVLNDPGRIDPWRGDIAALALRHRLPGAAQDRRWVEAGVLICYGVNLSAIHRRLAFYVDKILKGAKPADLPVLQPTKFEMIINLKAAKALGLELPAALLDRADKVIE
jgi:putative tryptophan/tyrosine transport system substrate-binding protein